MVRMVKTVEELVTFENDRCLFQSVTKAYSEKEHLSSPKKSRTYDLQILCQSATGVS